VFRMSELEAVKSKLDLLAEILNISTRRIQQLVEDGILPKPEKPGAYNIPLCVQCFYYNEFKNEESEELDGRYERARKAKAEADRIEFDLDIKKSLYLEADIVKSELEKTIGNCRAKLLVLPRKFAPLVSVAQNPNEVEEILTNGVTEALNELVEPVFNDSITRDTENTSDY